MKQFLLILFAISSIAIVAAQNSMPIINQPVFHDTDGNHINAHGGNIIKHGNKYYWYGEHRGDGTPGSRQLGVSCYSSKNLKDWKNEGIVLKTSDIDGHPLEQGCVIERPKVLFCPKTRKFVMWFHHELKGRGYGAAFAGVAVADRPIGPFRFLNSGRVNAGFYPLNLPQEKRHAKFESGLKWWTPEWTQAVADGLFSQRDLFGGQMARDMTLYVDDDGTPYHIFASEENLTLIIAKLDETYTRHTGEFVRVDPAGHNEAPTIFKHNGTYWMITSGCTGWAPNEARLLRADSILGPWTRLPNPCQGAGKEKTFNSQGTYIMQVGDNFTFMADRWTPKSLANSSHLWIPIKFDQQGRPTLSIP